MSYIIQKLSKCIFYFLKEKNINRFILTFIIIKLEIFLLFLVNKIFYNAFSLLY